MQIGECIVVDTYFSTLWTIEKNNRRNEVKKNNFGNQRSMILVEDWGQVVYDKARVESGHHVRN